MIPFIPLDLLLLGVTVIVFLSVAGSFLRSWLRREAILRRAFSPRLKSRKVELQVAEDLDFAGLKQRLDELESLGFVPFLDLEAAAYQYHTRSYVRCARHDSPPTFARLCILAKVGRRVVRPPKNWIVFYSFYADGAIVTGNLPYLVADHRKLRPGNEVLRLAGSPLREVWATHQRRMLQRKDAPRDIPAEGFTEAVESTEMPPPPERLQF